MDIKTISVAFVAIMVGAVAFGAMLPIFQDVTATEDTFTNEGLYHLEKITSSSEFTIVWDYTNPNQVTVNDEVVTLAQGGFPLTILFTDDIMVRVNYNTDCNVFGATDDLGANTLIGASVSGENNLSIVASSGTITVDNGTDSKTYPVTDGMRVSKNGPYVMKNTTTQAYVNGDSVFYTAGYTFRALNVQYTNFVGIFEGSIDDGVTTISQVPSTYTLSNLAMSYTNGPSGYTNFYKLTGFTYSVTDGENTGTLSYSQIIVPEKVNAERAIHGDSGFNTIVNLIPLVIGMGLLLIAVWWFVVRKF